MKITSATWITDGKDDTKKIGIWANIDGNNLGVPIDVNNKEYAEILKQVEEKTLTIEDAD